MRKSVTNGGNLKNNTLTVPAEKRNGIKKKAVNMRPSLEIDKIDLDAIRQDDAFEEPNAQIKNTCSIRDTLDHETLKKIDTYRALRLPTLRNMSQEECLTKYVNDPFFQKKLEYELHFLQKLTVDSKKPDQKVNKKQTIFTDINNQINSTTFRQCMHDEQTRKIIKKTKFENLLKRVTSQEQFHAEIKS